MGFKFFIIILSITLLVNMQCSQPQSSWYQAVPSLKNVTSLFGKLPLKSKAVIVCTTTFLIVLAFFIKKKIFGLIPIQPFDIELNYTDPLKNKFVNFTLNLPPNKAKELLGLEISFYFQNRKSLKGKIGDFKVMDTNQSPKFYIRNCELKSYNNMNLVEIDTPVLLKIGNKRYKGEITVAKSSAFSSGHSMCYYSNERELVEELTKIIETEADKLQITYHMNFDKEVPWYRPLWCV